MTSLRAMAKAALVAAAAAARERDAKLRAETERFYRQQFHQTFGVSIEELGGVVDYDLVYVDGLVLRREQPGWQLLGICPACGQPVWSTYFHKLPGLGAMIQSFRPSLHWAGLHLPCDDVPRRFSPETLHARLEGDEQLRRALGHMEDDEQEQLARRMAVA